MIQDQQEHKKSLENQLQWNEEQVRILFRHQEPASTLNLRVKIWSIL